MVEKWIRLTVYNFRKIGKNKCNIWCENVKGFLDNLEKLSVLKKLHHKQSFYDECTVHTFQKKKIDTKRIQSEWATLLLRSAEIISEISALRIHLKVHC